MYDLIASHGAVEDMVFFATHMEGTADQIHLSITLPPPLFLLSPQPPPLDYEKVIIHCIQHCNYSEALKVLTEKAEAVLKLPQKERRIRFKPFAELFYKFSPALVKRCALDTVKAWIIMGKHLDPSKLIPALIQFNQPAESAQVRRGSPVLVVAMLLLLLLCCCCYVVVVVVVAMLMLLLLLLLL